MEKLFHAKPALKSILFSLLAFGLLAAQAVAEDPGGWRRDPPIRTLAPADARADIALMRRALETIHPGLTRRVSKAELDDAFAALERRATEPLTDAELYREISWLLARIQCSHTKAEMPEPLEEFRTNWPSHFPFRFRILEGRIIVSAVAPNVEGLGRGAEILEVDGRPASELIATLSAYVAADGKTDASRIAKLADDGDLMGASFDHFYPFVYGFPIGFELLVRDADDAAPRKLALQPISFEEWQKIPNDGAVYRAGFGDAVRWRMLNADTAYLDIPTFVNYRKPVDAAALYAKIFAEAKEAGAKRLIIDMRENGGGSNDAALALIDALARRPYVYQRSVRLKAVRYGDLPDFISTWGDREALFNPPFDRFMPGPDGAFDRQPPESPEELLPRGPAPAGFAGPVTVLTGPKNESGATMSIAKLRASGRVRLVGERSGGSADGPTAGTVFLVRLPKSGIGVRVPLAFNEMQLAQFDADGGVTPDLPVTPTVAAFREGKDVVLDAALAEPITGVQVPPEPGPVALLAGLSGSWSGTRQGATGDPVNFSVTATLSDDGQRLTWSSDTGESITLTYDSGEAILCAEQSGTATLWRATGAYDAQSAEPQVLRLWRVSGEGDAREAWQDTLTLSPQGLEWRRERRAPGGSYSVVQIDRLTR